MFMPTQLIILDIKTFYDEFREKMISLNKEGIITELDEPENIRDSTVTFMFNIAIYQIAKERGYKLKVEKGGRGGFTDITILSGENNEKIIEIEHENRPTKENSYTGIEAFQKSVWNLLDSDAKLKVLITYEYHNCSKEYLKKRFKELISEKDKGNMFLIIGINTDNFDELDYLDPYSTS